MTLNDIIQACSCSADWVIELVEQGALDPLGQQQTQWLFPADNLQRAHTAMRLQNDLGVNLAGVALALDLLDEIENLRTRLCLFETD